MNQSNPEPNKEFEITIHNNGDESKFKVHPFDSIFSILNKLPKRPYYSIPRLIYNNIILSYAFSFAFYGIEEGSHIYVISSPQMEFFESKKDQPKRNSNNLQLFDRKELKKSFEMKYGKFFSSDEEFDKHCRLLNDPTLSTEVAKLKDLFFQRIEGTLKCHRRYVRSFFQNMENNSNHSSKTQ